MEGQSRTYYYARVSARDQKLDRQLAAFKTLGAKDREIVTDKESGKDLERPGYQALKTTILRPGDTLVIKSLDRLSRSKTDIRNELHPPDPEGALPHFPAPLPSLPYRRFFQSAAPEGGFSACLHPLLERGTAWAFPR